MAELFETQTKMKVRIAPADNSVRPGNTGADPVDTLDIMALTAWPLAIGDSDLTALPDKPADDDTADKNDESDNFGHIYDPRKASAAARARANDEIDDEDVLRDDPDDDDPDEHYERHRRHDERKKHKAHKPKPDDDGDFMDGEDEVEEGGSRFGGLRSFITRFGQKIIGTPGPDEIDE